MQEGPINTDGTAVISLAARGAEQDECCCES